MNDVTTAETVKTPLTLDEKIARAKAYLAKLEQQKLTEALTNDILEGDRVTIKFGRGDKTRNIDGKVVGTQDTKDGKIVAVLGDDFGTYKVHVRDVLANPTQAERSAPVADVEEIDPVTGRRPEEEGAVVADEAAADPLENA